MCFPGFCREEPQGKCVGPNVGQGRGYLPGRGQESATQVEGIDNRGSHYWLARDWSEELAKQTADAEVQKTFAVVAKELGTNEAKILKNLIDCQVALVDVGGYCHVGKADADKAMNTSETPNAIVARLLNPQAVEPAAALAPPVASMKAAEPAKRPRTTVTILIGFLGSGKTMLLNHILNLPDHGVRFATIENEFGEVGIDKKVITEAADEELIEVMNGCIYCTVRSNLIDFEEDVQESTTVRCYHHRDYQACGPRAGGAVFLRKRRH